MLCFGNSGEARPGNGLLGRAIVNLAEMLVTRPSDTPEYEFFPFGLGFDFDFLVEPWLILDRYVICLGC